MIQVDTDVGQRLLTRAIAPRQFSRIHTFLDRIGRDSLIETNTTARAYRNALFRTNFSELDNTTIVTGLDTELAIFARTIRATYDIKQKDVSRNLQITPRGVALLLVSESLYALQGDIAGIENISLEEVHTLTQLLSSNLANVLSLPQTSQMDVSPVFQEKALVRHMALANIGCLEEFVHKQRYERGNPRVVAEVLSVMETNTQLLGSFETILHSDDEILKAEVLTFFELIAQDTRLYSPEEKNEQARTNNYLLGRFFQNHPSLAALVEVTQKNEKKIQGKTAESYYSANEHPMVGDLLSANGEQLVGLLEQLEDIPCFADTPDETGFARAYESLQQGESAGVPESSPLGILKAFLFNRRQHDTTGDMFLVKRIFLQALAASPELFGPYEADIRRYLLAISQKKISKGSSITESELKALSSLTAGDALPDALPNETRNKILRGEPLVIDISTTALGDALLLCTNAYDIAQTIRKMGTKNKFSFVVSQRFYTVALALLKDIPEVQIQVSPGRNITEEQERDFLQALATDDKGRKGTIFKFYATRPITVDRDFIYQPFYLPVMPEITDATVAHSWSTFRRRMQANISDLAGTVLFDPQHPNESGALRSSLRNYTEDYLAVNPDQQLQLEKLGQDHAGGYICVVTNGSTLQKSLPKSAQSFILDAVADYCKKTDTAVVIINTEENSPILARQDDKRAAIYQTGIDSNIFYAASYLARAKAVIGPDTFLTHLAEFLPTSVLDLHVDSDASFWRLDERMHAAESFLARAVAEEGSWIYDPADSALYAAHFTHPFTLQMGRRKRLHALIRIAQESFAKDIQREIAILLSQVA